MFPENLIQGLIILSVLLGLALNGLSRLDRSVRLFGLQAAALGGLVAVLAYNSGHEEWYLTAGLTLVVKALIIPRILQGVLESTGDLRETRPLVGQGLSLIIGGALILTSYSATARLAWSAVGRGEFVPAGLALILNGFYLMISRRQALSQVLGLLVLENGIFILTLVGPTRVALLVEAGITLLLLVGVKVMATLARRISGALNTLDTGKLTSLKG